MVATWLPIHIGTSLLEAGNFTEGSPVPAVRYDPLPTLGFFDVDDPVEFELAVLYSLAGELGEGGVAVLVEAPGTEHAIIVPGEEVEDAAAKHRAMYLKEAVRVKEERDISGL